MLVEENKPLAAFTTLGIGGPARWFAEARSEDEIPEAADWARERGLSLFVLGGGSNLLVADAGFDGLVLHIGLRGVSVDDEAGVSGCVLYRAAAGEDWDSLVGRTVDDGCAGVECLAGIPGSVGGTPVQNVGAYGQEVASAIECVRAYDLERRAFVELTAAECGFAYRRSRFNTSDRGRFVVTRVDYGLTRGGSPSLHYADLQRAFPAGSAPSLKEAATAVRKIRESKGMLLVDGDPICRSVGSFFKNPVLRGEQIESIAKSCGKQPPRFPVAVGPESGARAKVPAAWLIEQAGFTKGYVLGSAAVSPRHTLALINRGGASANEILALAEQIRTTVAERFEVQLETEPVMVGFEKR